MTVDSTIKTTAGEIFDHGHHARLAALVFVRFGRDPLAAADAWARMLGNSRMDAETRHYWLQLVDDGLKLID
jgi:hypothetical protein